MELTTWGMYWLVKLDTIQMFLFFFGVLATAAALMFISAAWETEHRPIGIFATVCAFIMLTLGVLCPDTKQMAAIIIVPKIINDERVQNVPDKILELGLEWLEELRPDGRAAE